MDNITLPEAKKAFDDLLEEVDSIGKSREWIYEVCKTNKSNISRLAKPISEQLEKVKSKNKKSSESKLLEKYKIIIRTLQEQIAEYKLYDSSEYVKVYDPKKYWILPGIIAILCLLIGLFPSAKWLGEKIQETSISIVAAVGYAFNMVVVIFLLLHNKKNKVSNEPTDIRISEYTFYYYWTKILQSWLVMYSILFIWQSYLLSVHFQDLDGLLLPKKFTTGEIGLSVKILVNTISIYNTVFIFCCFSILHSISPLKIVNSKYVVRFKNFIVIATILMFFAVIDNIYEIAPALKLNSFFSIVYSCFTAVIFAFLVAKLWSPYFQSRIGTITMGLIFFYAACMPGFSNIQEETSALFNVIVILFYALGKAFFGDAVIEKMKMERKNGDEESSQLQEYLERMYEEN